VIIRKIVAFLLGMLLCGTAIAQTSPLLNMIFTNQPEGVVYSEDQQNTQSTQGVSLMCVFNMSSHTGTPRITYKIQGKVGSVDQYFDLLDSLTVSADNTPIVLIMGPGVENAPKLNKALPVPPIWRIAVTIGNQTVSPLTVNGVLACRVQ